MGGAGSQVLGTRYSFRAERGGVQGRRERGGVQAADQDEPHEGRPAVNRGVCALTLCVGEVTCARAGGLILLLRGAVRRARQSMTVRTRESLARHGRREPQKAMSDRMEPEERSW